MRSISTFLFLILFSGISFGQNGWPRYSGPFRNFSQAAPASGMVNGSQDFRYIFTTEDVVPTAASQSPRYGNGGHASSQPHPSGGGFSSIAVDGKLFQNYFQPSGRIFDTTEYRKRFSPTGNLWYPELWLLNADEIFLCVDARSGKTKWRTVVEKAGFNHLDHKGVLANGSPVYHNGRVYFLSSVFEVFCLDTANGNVLWRRPSLVTPLVLQWKNNSLNRKRYLGQANREFNLSLDVIGGTLIVPTSQLGNSQRLQGLDPATGNVLWTTSSNVQGGTSVATGFWKAPDDQEYIVVANNEGIARMINPATGAQLWQLTGLGNNAYAILTQGNYMVVRTADTTYACYRLSLTGADFQWKLPKGSLQLPSTYKVGMVGSPDGRHVYIRGDGTLGRYYMVNLETGNIVATGSASQADEAADYRYGNLLFSEGDSQHNSFSASIMRADSGAFPSAFGWSVPHKPITSYAVPLQPAMANGTFYIRGSGGIHAYRMDAPANLKLTFVGFGARNTFRNPGDSIRVRVTATGNPETFRLFLNGAQVALVQNQAELNFLLPSIPAGSHQFEARAEKASTNESISAFLYVNARNIGKVVVVPDSQRLKVGESFLFSAQSFFDNGTQWYRQYVDLNNPIPQPQKQWSVGDSGGTIDANGYFTASRAGNFYVRIRAGRNGVFVTDSVLVMVEKAPQVLTYLPAPDFFVTQPGIRLGGMLNSGLPVQYEVVSGPGLVENDSLKPTGTAGTVILKVFHPGNLLYLASNEIFDTIRILELGVPDRIRINPDSLTLEAHSAVQLTAVLLNNSGFPLPFSGTVTWQILEHGWVTPQGVFTADTLLGWKRVRAELHIDNQTFADTAWYQIVRPSEVISISFNRDNSDFISANTEAGVIRRRYWFNSSSGSTGLKNDKGDLLATQIQFNGFGNVYTTQDAGTDGDRQMMRTFRGTQGASNLLTLQLNNLPSNFKTHGYNAYVYWGNHENNNKVIGLQAGNQTELFIRDNDATWKGTFTRSFATSAANAQPGQEYVGFENLQDTVFSLNLRMTNNIQRWGISGLQLYCPQAAWGKKAQIITFPEMPNQPSNAAPFPILASASSGLSPQFTLVSGPASLSNGIITLNGQPGIVTIRANQPGNGEYQSASPVERSFFVYVVTGLDKSASKGIFMYPNPTAGKVTVKNAAGLHFQVLNIQGKVVKTFTISREEEELDLSDFSKGVYLLRSDSPGKVPFHTRLVVQ